jgi:hypothetical protein
MARGKPWTEEEIKVLREMAEQRLSAQEIYESGKLPNRTYEAIRKQLERRRLVVSRQKTFVETIEPSEDALSMGLGVTSELEFLE